MAAAVSELASRTEKCCPRCQLVKSVEDFNRDSGRVDGRNIWCRDCCRTHRQERADYYRDYEFRRRYGISLAEYDEMYRAQGGVCAICEQGCIQKSNLAVDHCHTTGAVRGLLCGRCNQAIGLLREDLTLLRRAAEYLSPKGV